VLRPVDNEFTPLWAVLMPVEVEVERLPTAPFVVLKPVDSEPMPVDNEETPLCAVLIPVDVEVDRLPTALFVALKPVDSEVTPLCAALIPVDVEVDRLPTALFVVIKLVDSEFTPLCAVLILVENVPTVAESIARLLLVVKSCDPLTALVLVAFSAPAATPESRTPPVALVMVKTLPLVLLGRK
jgi:hypothetical protein